MRTPSKHRSRKTEQPDFSENKWVMLVLTIHERILDPFPSFVGSSYCLCLTDPKTLWTMKQNKKQHLISNPQPWSQSGSHPDPCPVIDNRHPTGTSRWVQAALAVSSSQPTRLLTGAMHTAAPSRKTKRGNWDRARMCRPGCSTRSYHRVARYSSKLLGGRTPSCSLRGRLLLGTADLRASVGMLPW